MENHTVECNVCGQWYQNWTGSTPCCGSIAFLVDENGEKTNKTSLFASIRGEPIKSMIIKTNK